MAPMAEVLTLLAPPRQRPVRSGRTTRTPAYAGRWLFAVADGMGGHAAGEVASAAVIESLRAHDADRARTSCSRSSVGQ